MKVFLVERGEYSSRYTAGVFSSKELADADVTLNDGDGYVEEYEVDEHAGEIKRTIFMASIDLESGEIFDEQSHPWTAQPHLRGYLEGVRDFRDTAIGLSLSFGRISQQARSFESAEHARKMAAEARQVWLRERAMRQEGEQK